MPPAAIVPPAAPGGGAPPPLPPPAVAHVLSRITIPGTEVELDYVSVDKSAAVVKAFPDLGWKDSSAVTANTVAVPLLSLAGVVCLPAFIDDPTTPASKTILTEAADADRHMYLCCLRMFASRCVVVLLVCRVVITSMIY